MDLRLALILSVLLIALAAWALLVGVMFFARARPPRLTRLKALFVLGRATPADLNIPYEEIWIDSGPANLPCVRICAWFIPAEPLATGTIVILHGYADSSSGAAAWLPAIRATGCNALLIDLPGHGESGNAPSTAGARESRYVSDVLSQFTASRPAESTTLILFGISMGAATALAVANTRNDIAGVIVDSPYQDFQDAAARHARLFGLPGAWVQAPAAWLAEKVYKVRFNDVAPIQLLEKVKCPVLLIQAGEDQLVSREAAAQMRDVVNARPGSKAIDITGAPHILGLAASPDQYASELANFVAALRGNSTRP